MSDTVIAGFPEKLITPSPEAGFQLAIKHFRFFAIAAKTGHSASGPIAAGLKCAHIRSFDP